MFFVFSLLLAAAAHFDPVNFFEKKSLIFQTKQWYENGKVSFLNQISQTRRNQGIHLPQKCIPCYFPASNVLKLLYPPKISEVMDAMECQIMKGLQKAERGKRYWGKL